MTWKRIERVLRANLDIGTVRQDTLNQVHRPGNECDLGFELAIFDGSWSLRYKSSEI